MGRGGRLKGRGTICMHMLCSGAPGGSDGKKPACSSEDPVRSLCWKDFPGVGNGNPLRYSRLENSTERGVWRATVHGVAKSQT